MNSDEIIAKMREGLDAQIHDVIERDDVPQPYVQQVTQSWLLLQILERLDAINCNVTDVENAIDTLNLVCK